MNQEWCRSTYSGPDGGNCVECRTADGVVHIRDTRHRELGHLTIPTTEWHTFLAAVRSDHL